MAGKKKEEPQQPITIEEAFAELTEIVERMEAPDVTLEETMQLYRKGTTLLAQCTEKLDAVEKEMIILTEEGELPDGETTGTDTGN